MLPGIFRSIELELKAEIKRSDSPFLGLFSIFLKDRTRTNLIFLINDSDYPYQKYLENLAFYPALLSTLLISIILEDFGKHGYFEIYPILRKIFDEDLTQSQKTRLWRSFRRACLSLDLSISPRTFGPHFMVGDNENKFVYIDPETGRLSDDERNGENVKLIEVDTVRDEIERNDYVRTCKACGSQATGALAEIISHMHTGNEAFGSVVTQKVLEALPGEKDFYEPKPMMGRSLLTFSDSRQNAAYFAPYFERTSGDMALRTAIIRVLKKENEALNLGDLSDLVLKYWKKFGQPVILGSSGEIIESNTKKTDHVLGSVAAEFCTPGGRRNSLEALGLVKVTYHKNLMNRLIRTVNDFVPENKTINTENLSHILLETIRREKAIANLYDIDMSDPFIWWETYKRHRAFELYKANPKISNAWLTQEGRKQHNRRTWFFIERLKWSLNESREFLSNFWQALLDLKILINIHPGFGLDAKLIRISPGVNYNLYYCEDCGLSIFDVVDNCCTAFKCRGNTQLISEKDRESERHRNHYIYNIENGRALTIRAREHTASLSTDLRQKIEQEFSERKINVLSCTTTMEMGVDLGELEAVMCLNIPPGITNYQQRTGRAGRRAQAAPFCVTTARNSQYDQAVFRNFREYLEKPAPIPRIHLENAKLFQRHQNSIILSGFLKHKILDLSINAPSISDLFGLEFNEESYNNYMDIVYNWIESDEGKTKIAEAENLALKLPNDLENSIALKSFALKQQFIKQLMMLAVDVKERWDLYSNKMKSFAEQNDYKKAAHWDNLRSKYMKQFLVSQLSFYGMIPTYSFPVNSLNLEVTREYGLKNVYSGEKDISLSRDAILGIAEYAPGAEIVANGRIWSSQGLAYYPRDFMPTRFYTYCQECQHVEVSEDKIDLPSSCSFCGNQHLGLRRNFIEPKGFVTAYKDRKGKDPARYRVRKQFADEARLISLAKDDDFELSDHPFISKALLRSHSINKDVPIGTLFVVNRGPFGMGYHRCSLCNYMVPAKKAELKTQKHTELLGDTKCNNEKFTWPIDIAHIFNTDICIFRFNKRIPILKDETTKSEHRRYIDSFARTMSETLRFAATTVLNLNLDVMRATHKINDGHLSIIIFDSVPGGAGYSVRLFNEAKVNDIINAAINRLDCSNNCSSACRTCLCDYSNQKAWDLFERKPVLDWLKQISRHDAEQPIIKAGGKEWKSPSYSGLTEKLSQYDNLYILGRTLLTKHSTYDGDAVRWLIERLNADNRVHILLTEKLDVDSFRTHQERLILNYLKPYIENQQLLIGNIDYEGTFTKVPRLIVQPLRGLPAFFTHYAIPAILDQILPPPIYELALDNEITDRMNKLLDSKSIYDAQSLFPPHKKMIRWSLNAGSQRKYDEYFSELKDKYVEKLVIKDPYCGSGDRQIKSLQEFIKLLKRQIKQLRKVEIYCKELSYRNPNYRSSGAVRNEIVKSLKQIITIEPNVKIIDFSYGRNFHDRSVVASTINENGETTTHIYDLSGGIDFLMDENKETKIFYSQKIKN